MPFKDVLLGLCHSVPGACGAIFVDHEGECIQQTRTSDRLTDYDLAVAGAHASPMLDNGLGNAELTVRGPQGVVIIQIVEGAYALVLVGDHTLHTAVARRRCSSAARQLKALM